MRFLHVFLAILFLFFLSASFTQSTYAVYDPLSRPNNFFGIHILFPEELSDAAKLVNSSGGDWGYVTIPIQSGDRNLEKWQKFMNDAAALHLTPILRLATENYYKDTSVWRIPTEYDIIDFANFLDSLWWPTKNRYVILFNEVNRSDEWGGKPPDPKAYSELVEFSVDTFKSRNQDFFLLFTGLDNAAPTKYPEFLSEFDFLSRVPSTVWNKISGIASHSYPNPAFSATPNKHKQMGVATYKHELSFIRSSSSLEKPIFITETGWSTQNLTDEKAASFFKETFESIWSEDQNIIVAVTPFLLRSENGSFDQFSFLTNGKPTVRYNTVLSIPKAKGEPLLNEYPPVSSQTAHMVKNISKNGKAQTELKVPQFLKTYLKTMFGLD